MCVCMLTVDILLQFFKGLNITADQKKIIRKAFHSYYDAAAELLQSEHSVRWILLVDRCRSSWFILIWT